TIESLNSCTYRLSCVYHVNPSAIGHERRSFRCLGEHLEPDSNDIPRAAAGYLTSPSRRYSLRLAVAGSSGPAITEIASPNLRDGHLSDASKGGAPEHLPRRYRN